jgi:hypothetical protein
MTTRAAFRLGSIAGGLSRIILWLPTSGGTPDSYMACDANTRNLCVRGDEGTPSWQYHCLSSSPWLLGLI